MSAITGSAIALAAAMAYLAPAVMWRRVSASRLRARCMEKRALVLTYDDGPGERMTPRLLERLAAHGAPATFFMVGSRVREAPEIVERVAAAGHEIGCHTERHLHALRAAPWRALADIHAGYRSLSRWVAPDGPFRPPYGKVNGVTLAALLRRGARVGSWTANSEDTSRALPDPARKAEEILSEGGAVVLLHDYDGRAERDEFTLELTDALLRGARERGMTVMRLGDLFAERPVREGRA